MIIASFIMSPVAFAVDMVINFEIIRTNCNAARSTIQRIVSVDKITRINRGWTYDRMGKLFTNFNERLRQNRIDNQQFVELSGKFNQATAAFRANYDDYKNSIEYVINTDCTVRPSDFYDALKVARAKRQKINDKIIELDDIIVRYHTAVNELSQSLYGEKQ